MRVKFHSQEMVSSQVGKALQKNAGKSGILEEEGNTNLRETLIKSRRERLASYFVPDQGAKPQESFVDFKISQRRAGAKEPPSAEDGFNQRFLSPRQ